MQYYILLLFYYESIDNPSKTLWFNHEKYSYMLDLD